MQRAIQAAGLAIPRVAAALRVCQANSQLGGSSIRDIGFERDIDPQDMLYSHWKDQASAFKTPPISAPAWGTEHRMEKGDHCGSESELHSLLRDRHTATSSVLHILRA